MKFFSYKLHTAFGIRFQNLVTFEVISVADIIQGGSRWKIVTVIARKKKANMRSV